MKGKTIIEILDSKGNVVSKNEEHNFITNAFKDYVTILANMAVPSSHINSERQALNSISQKYTGIISDTAFNKIGIKVFSHNLEENPSKYYCPDVPLTYATQSTVLTQGKGIYNTLSSKKLTNDEGVTVGFRFVWDFATNVGNGEIKAICLTPICNKVGEETQKNNHFTSGNTDVSIKSQAFTYEVEGKHLTTRTRTGKQIKVTNNNVINIEKDEVTPSITYKNWEITTDNYIIHEVIGYTSMFKVIDIDDFYLTIGKNTSSSKYELLKLNKETFAIEESKELDTNMDSFTDFGVVGTKGSLDDIDYVIYYTTKRNNAYFYSSTVKAYNLTTKELTNVGDTSATSLNYYGGAELCVLEGQNSELVTKVFYAKYGYDGISMVYRSVNGEFMTTNKCYNKMFDSWNIGTNTHFGLSPICLLQSQNTNGNAYVTLGFDTNTLFTINNLETPITKTDANTMKITYELTWGE